MLTTEKNKIMTNVHWSPIATQLQITRKTQHWPDHRSQPILTPMVDSTCLSHLKLTTERTVDHSRPHSQWHASCGWLYGSILCFVLRAFSFSALIPAQCLQVCLSNVIYSSGIPLVARIALGDSVIYTLVSRPDTDTLAFLAHSQQSMQFHLPPCPSAAHMNKCALFSPNYKPWLKCSH